MQRALAQGEAAPEGRVHLPAERCEDAMVATHLLHDRRRRDLVLWVLVVHHDALPPAERPTEGGVEQRHREAQHVPGLGFEHVGGDLQSTVLSLAHHEGCMALLNAAT
jgi:hypothetical protein